MSEYGGGSHLWPYHPLPDQGDPQSAHRGADVQESPEHSRTEAPTPATRRAAARPCSRQPAAIHPILARACRSFRYDQDRDIVYWSKLPWEAIGHLYTGMDGGSGEMAPTTFPMPPAAWAGDARLLDTLVPSTSTSGSGLSSSAFLVAGARNRRSNLRMEGAHKAAPAATWSSGSGNGSHGHGLPRRGRMAACQRATARADIGGVRCRGQGARGGDGFF